MADTTDVVKPGGSLGIKPGIYTGKVVNLLDKTYMGMITVKLDRYVGNDEAEGQSVPVAYASPFYGTTKDLEVNTNDYANTQKSYGFWMVPPDVGTSVVVVFANGNEKYGYWLGCIPEENMNFMVPGIAATKFTVDGSGRVPVAEYNKTATGTVTDPTKAQKPKHPLTDVLEKQGLLKDDVRGITTSSARREVPSMVYGISTPGPVDKSGPKVKVGSGDDSVNIPASRLGGTTFVMDDGDAAYLRKTPASDGPPEYVHAEGEETGGDLKIPHNELVRIRTRTGHQILLHNSEDLIYIGNAKGTTWIELTSKGKIDIYAADDISMHTEGNFNITADKDINLTSTAGSINLNAKKNFNTTATGDMNIKVTGSGKITTTGTLNLKSTAETNMQASQTNITATKSIKLAAATVDLNAGAGALPAAAITAPIAQRVPQHEPWAGHENLHNTALKYSTVTDTFEKFLPAK